MAESQTRSDMTMAQRIEELRRVKARLQEMGGAKRVEKQHEAGKLSARERVAKLLDKESFQEQYAFAQHRCNYFGMADKDLPADGVVTGCGAVDGRLIHLASQEFTVSGGAAGKVHCDKIVKMME